MDGAPTTDTTVQHLTFDAAMDNAARLLRNAEGETDRHLMERYEKLADSWISMAAHIAQRDRDLT